MSSLEEIEPMIRIYRGDLKTKSNLQTISTISPTELTNLDDLQSENGISFLYVSPVPENEQTIFRNRHENLSRERIFASIVIKPVTIFELEMFLSEFYANTNEYANFLTRYLNERNIRKVVSISTFRRVYSAAPFEVSPAKGTYVLNRSRVHENTPFERARMLGSNWASNAGRKLVNYEYHTDHPFEPLRGKPIHFLHKDAGKLLWSYVEKKLQSIGIECITLQADTMSLAIKIYGPAGYYPMWEVGKINPEGDVVLNGSKAPMLSHNERFQTCDFSQGPQMFKLIGPTQSSPRYNWSKARAICSSVERRVGGRRKTRTNRKKRTTRKL